jgi:hypothetical protein
MAYSMHQARCDIRPARQPQKKSGCFRNPTSQIDRWRSVECFRINQLSAFSFGPCLNDESRFLVAHAFCCFFFGEIFRSIRDHYGHYLGAFLFTIFDFDFI